MLGYILDIRLGQFAGAQQACLFIGPGVEILIIKGAIRHFIYLFPRNERSQAPSSRRHIYNHAKSGLTAVSPAALQTPHGNSPWPEQPVGTGNMSATSQNIATGALRASTNARRRNTAMAIVNRTTQSIGKTRAAAGIRISSGDGKLIDSLPRPRPS
jgi:hypothetical protein